MNKNEWKNYKIYTIYNIRFLEILFGMFKSLSKKLTA